MRREKEQLSDGRIEELLDDIVPATVNGDHGADHAALSTAHLQQFADAGLFVQVLPVV